MSMQPTSVQAVRRSGPHASQWRLLRRRIRRRLLGPLKDERVRRRCGITERQTKNQRLKTRSPGPSECFTIRRGPRHVLGALPLPSFRYRSISIKSLRGTLASINADRPQLVSRLVWDRRYDPPLLAIRPISIHCYDAKSRQIRVAEGVWKIRTPAQNRIRHILGCRAVAVFLYLPQ